MKKLTILIALTGCLNSSAFADVANLVRLNLPEQAISRTEESKTSKVLGRLRLSPPPGLEGVIPLELPSGAVEYSGSTKRQLDNILTKASEMALGERLDYFEKAAAEVLRFSGTNQNEAVLRMTVNRAVEIVNTIIGSIGRNTSEDARMLVNFYTGAFEMARKYAGGAQPLIAEGASRDNKCGVTPVLIGDYGVEFATMVFRKSSIPTISQSAKSILLIYTAAYLGHDIFRDLRTRLQIDFQDIMADIIDLQQKNQNMANVLNSLESEEPSRADSEKVRLSVFKILEKSQRATTQFRVPCNNI